MPLNSVFLQHRVRTLYVLNKAQLRSFLLSFRGSMLSTPLLFLFNLHDIHPKLCNTIAFQGQTPRSRDRV